MECLFKQEYMKEEKSCNCNCINCSMNYHDRCKSCLAKRNEVIVGGSKLKTDIPFSAWKNFEKLMNRLDKAKLEVKQAIEKRNELQSVVNKRAKYLGIGENGK